MRNSNPPFPRHVPSSSRAPRRRESRSHRSSRAQVVGLCLAVWLGGAALPACGLRPAGPTLASGQQPVTGVANYDAFFGGIHDLLERIGEAERELAEARAALSRRVALPENAAVDALGERLRDRTSRWAEEGLTLELAFSGIAAGDEFASAVSAAPAPAERAAPQSGEALAADADPANVPTATLRTPGRQPERRELRLLEVVAQAALASAKSYVEMAQAERRTRELLARIPELRAHVEEAFSDGSRRETVYLKLEEAEELLPELRERARRAYGAADLFISLLDEAANTEGRSGSARGRSPAGGRSRSPAQGRPSQPTATADFP